MAARGRSGDTTYTKDVRSQLLKQVRAMERGPVSVQDRKSGPSQQEMRRSIENGECPFCSKKFKNIAAHTNRTHGVDRFELKEMAGIPKSLPACSPEFTEVRSAAAKASVTPEHIYKLRSAPRPKTRKYSSAGRAVQRAKLGRADEAYRFKGGEYPLPAKTPEQIAEYARRAGVTNSQRRLAAVAERDVEIVRRSQAGEFLRDIAADLGIATKTAKEALRRAGITADLRAQAALHEDRKGKAVAALRAGASARAEQIREDRLRRWRELGKNWDAVAVLAGEWGCSEKTVRQYLRDSGESLPDGRAVSPKRGRQSTQAEARLLRWAELGKGWPAIEVMSQELGLRPQGLAQYLRNLGEYVPDGRSVSSSRFNQKQTQENSA